MDEHDWLAKRFEDTRDHLRAVAYRMLGPPGDADDAVQEAWLRLSRTDAGAVRNLEGWLTSFEMTGCGAGGFSSAQPRMSQDDWLWISG